MDQRCTSTKVVVDGNWEKYMWPDRIVRLDSAPSMNMSTEHSGDVVIEFLCLFIEKKVRFRLYNASFEYVHSNKKGLRRLH